MQSKHLSILALGALALSAFTVPARAALLLTITEAMSSSGVTDDWFEVTNTSTETVDLSTFKVDDSSFAFATSLTLNNVTNLLPGRSAVFIESAAGANVEAFRSYWGLVPTALIGYYSGSGVGLSSAGDGLVLFDGAGTEATPRANFGAATTGSSFYFDRGTGALIGISAAGQAGVYTSNTTYNGAAAAANVGSPEFAAVPEPAACVCVVLGAATVLAAARRRQRA